MTLVRIGLDVNGQQQLARGFEASAREVQDMSDPLTEVGQHLIRQIGEQFATEGAAGGTPWQRLSRAYEQWKEEAFPGRPILVRSGQTRDKATSDSTIMVEPRRLVYEVEGHATDPVTHESYDVGEVAYWHQHGKGNNPARPIVQLNQAARREVDRIFSNWLNGIRRGSFAGR